ncbi:hypothetical protein Tco_0089950 [Tanacetum coccineum]
MILEVMDIGRLQIAVYTIITWVRTVMKNANREDMLLNKAYKIGKMLQEKLEQLAKVERAFVHIDFEFSHVTDLNTKPRSS